MSDRVTIKEIVCGLALLAFICAGESFVNLVFQVTGL